MPKPKLPEEDKKGVVPLRLPPADIASLHKLAEEWGEKRNKEVKPATVARELVLIGLDVVAAIRQNRMLAELLQDGDNPERISRIRQIVNQSISNGISAEEVAHAIVKILYADRPELIIAPTSPVTKRNPRLDDKPIPTEEKNPLGAPLALKQKR